MTPFAEGSLLRDAPATPALGIDALAPGGVLVLAPHPDDETLGCGAALATAVHDGRDAHVVVVTDGGASHPGSVRWPRERLARRRAEELAAALDVLGGGRITHERLGFPDQGIPAPGDPDVTDALARVIATMVERRLDTVWTSWEGDPHPDHVRCAALADTLAGELFTRATAGVSVFRFAVWGRFVERTLAASEEALVRFVPTLGSRALKESALACHASQMSDLIDDDPNGFVMPCPMQRHFIEHDELFVRRCVP